MANKEKAARAAAALNQSGDPGAPPRVNFSRRAYADLSSHANESLDAEVCGVLVGEVRREDDAPAVEVRAVIRGAAAREARAHVTFTHETWNQIHATLDKDYPDLQIVGWYHTHPGFGVEFSAMDRFIQENFFSGKQQVAYLTDPLGGDIALAWNAEGGIDYMTKFTVDGREHTARNPTASSVAQSSDVAGAPARGDLERIEARINQLVAALDEERANFHRVLMTLVVIVCLAVVGGVTYFIYDQRASHLEPPRINSFAPVPVKIGNETVLLGVGIVEWRVPPDLDAMMDKVAKAEVEARKQLELERMKLEKKKK